MQPGSYKQALVLHTGGFVEVSHVGRMAKYSRFGSRRRPGHSQLACKPGTCIESFQRSCAPAIPCHASQAHAQRIRETFRKSQGPSTPQMDHMQPTYPFGSRLGTRQRQKRLGSISWVCDGSGDISTQVSAHPDCSGR